MASMFNLKSSKFCESMRLLGLRLVDSCMSDTTKVETYNTFMQDVSTIEIAETILDDENSNLNIIQNQEKQIAEYVDEIEKLKLQIRRMERERELQYLHISLLRETLKKYEDTYNEK